MIASLQIGFVRLAAFGVGLSQLGLIRSGQFQAQFFGNVSGDFFWTVWMSAVFR